MDEMLILVDAEDNAIGSQTKMRVHQQGLLHRAFSIFIFDSQGVCCCSSGLSVNITRLVYGPTHAAATRDGES